MGMITEQTAESKEVKIGTSMWVEIRLKLLREIGIRLQFGLVTAILGDAGAHS